MTDIIKRYLSVNLADYSNIKLDLEINKVVLIILVGLIVATVIISIKRSIMITTVKKLFRYEATSEGNAKTPAELKITSPLIIRELKGETRLSRIVSIVGQNKLTYDEYIAEMKSKKKREKINYSEAKLYISPDKISEAKIIEAYPSVSFINTLLICVLYFIAATCLIIIMPEILKLINNILAP